MVSSISFTRFFSGGRDLAKASPLNAPLLKAIDSAAHHEMYHQRHLAWFALRHPETLPDFAAQKTDCGYHVMFENTFIAFRPKELRWRFLLSHQRKKTLATLGPARQLNTSNILCNQLLLFFFHKVEAWLFIEKIALWKSRVTTSWSCWAS